jgi:prophage DNA circulation protein
MTTPYDLAASAQSLVASLYATAQDPADALRILAGLLETSSTAPAASDAIGIAMTAMQTSMDILFRRAVVVAMARASADYQPSSSDDAAAIRTQVCAALEAEITVAADIGDDASFMALRSLMAAVSFDLNQRGASLSPVAMIATGQPLPSLVLAQRQYQDIGREQELVTEASPVHPAFMPISFDGLAQ